MYHQLNSTEMYYLTVPIGQESRHRLPRSSTRGARIPVGPKHTGAVAAGLSAFLLALSQGQPFAPRGCPQFLATWTPTCISKVAICCLPSQQESPLGPSPSLKGSSD